MGLTSQSNVAISIYSFLLRTQLKPPWQDARVHFPKFVTNLCLSAGAMTAVASGWGDSPTSSQVHFMLGTGVLTFVGLSASEYKSSGRLRHALLSVAVFAGTIAAASKGIETFPFH
jgi:hypothetical protein